MGEAGQWEHALEKCTLLTVPSFFHFLAAMR
jgi:hypothetical protein